MRIDTNTQKEVYYINGYEYTKEDLAILNTIIEPNLP